MDHYHPQGDAHSHGGHKHVHAHVDHLASDFGDSARLIAQLDNVLMAQLGVSSGDLVRVATERGRSIIARLDVPKPEDKGTGIMRLNRFMRQALKAHLNEDIEIEPAKLGPAKKVELTPAVDVTMAHDLVPHLKEVMVKSRTPVSVGAVLYVAFPNSHAGTTYE